MKRQKLSAKKERTNEQETFMGKRVRKRIMNGQIDGPMQIDHEPSPARLLACSLVVRSLSHLLALPRIPFVVLFRREHRPLVRRCETSIPSGHLHSTNNKTNYKKRSQPDFWHLLFLSCRKHNFHQSDDILQVKYPADKTTTLLL